MSRLCRPSARPLQILAAIGEQWDDGDEVCGIVVNMRPKQDRLQVWTKTASNEAAQVRGMGRVHGRSLLATRGTGAACGPDFCPRSALRLFSRPSCVRMGSGVSEEDGRQRKG